MPAKVAVTLRGEPGEVVSAQPGRLAELPLSEAVPVQEVAPLQACPSSSEGQLGRFHRLVRPHRAMTDPAAVALAAEPEGDPAAACSVLSRAEPGPKQQQR